MYQLSDWIVFLKQKFPENNGVLKTTNRWRSYTCLHFLIYHGCAWLNLEGQTLISTTTGKVTWSVHLVHVQVVKRGQWIARVPLEHEEVEASSLQTSETRRKVGSWEALGVAWGTWCCGACFGRCALVPGRASCWNWSSCKEDQRGSLRTAGGYKEPGGLLPPQRGDIREGIEEWRETKSELSLLWYPGQTLVPCLPSFPYPDSQFSLRSLLRLSFPPWLHAGLALARVGLWLPHTLGWGEPLTTKKNSCGCCWPSCLGHRQKWVTDAST